MCARISIVLAMPLMQRALQASVILANARIQDATCASRLGAIRCSRRVLIRRSRVVAFWIPAFAGMTEAGDLPYPSAHGCEGPRVRRMTHAYVRGAA